jgi:hypothetical protein
MTDKPQDTGVPPSGSGYSAEPEPSFTVSAVPVSIPNAVRVASAFSLALTAEHCTEAADTIEELVEDNKRLREAAEWISTVRYCIEKALSGEPTRESLLLDLRSLKVALAEIGGDA